MEGQALIMMIDPECGIQAASVLADNSFFFFFPSLFLCPWLGSWLLAIRIVSRNLIVLMRSGWGRGAAKTHGNHHTGIRDGFKVNQTEKTSLLLNMSLLWFEAILWGFKAHHRRMFTALSSSLPTLCHSDFFFLSFLPWVRVLVLAQVDLGQECWFSCFCFFWGVHIFSIFSAHILVHGAMH